MLIKNINLSFIKAHSLELNSLDARQWEYKPAKTKSDHELNLYSQ